MRKLRKLKQIYKNRRSIIQLIKNRASWESNFCGSLGGDDEKGILRAIELSHAYEGPMVEIGILFGHTTQIICSKKAPDKIVYGVDNFCWNPIDLTPDQHRKFTRSNLRYLLDHQQVIIFDGAGNEFYEQHPDLRPSMIFIDAMHHYEDVKADIECALQSGCPVICGHDYSDNFPGVKRAVDEYFGNNFDRFGAVWVHERPA